jgi:hypothetical protein
VKLATVLAEIEMYERDGVLHTFSVRYVKRDGKVGEKLRCRKAGGSAGTTVAASSSKFRYSVKEKGVLLLINADTDEPFSIKISRLTHFNGVRVKHWC